MVEKHFRITIGKTGMSWGCRHERIRAEARFDRIYVIRTSLEGVEPDAAVASCRRLSTVERAPDGQAQRNLPRSTDGQPLGVSPGGKRKAATERTSGGLVVHSSGTLLDDISGVVLNWGAPPRTTGHRPGDPDAADPDPGQGPQAAGRHPPSICSHKRDGTISGPGA